MKIYGIVCEFNPFHSGHRYLMEQTIKQTNADALICVMSGSMVQRGDIAVFDKWTRAKAAVQNGADLVIELPTAYVLQSADTFACGAVEILNSLQADGISFGTETDDTELLRKLAALKIDEPPKYTEVLKASLDSGTGYPSACEKAARACIPDLPDEIFKPNATLAVSYICAAMRANTNLKFNAVKRVGDYHDETLSGDFSSASAIRKEILNGNLSVLPSEYGKNDIYDIESIAPLILGFFRLKKSDELSGISGMESGLAGRMIKAAKNSASLDDFIAQCVTKRYTAHRIRRCILCSLLGITRIEKPTYARVLALNKTGAAVLKEAAAKSDLDIITKTADYRYTPDSMFEKDILATDLQALCGRKKASVDFTTPPYTAMKGE